jgi:exopolysaccharide biosynthesis protein
MRQTAVPDFADREPNHGVIARILMGLGKFLIFLLVTLLIVAVGLYGTMWVLMKGPSPTAKVIFTRSVKETSAVGFLANLYLSEDEIEEIVGDENNGADTEATDVSLIKISVAGPSSGGKDPSSGDQEPSGGTEPDSQDGGGKEDGIEILDIKSDSYRGKLMIVDDPTRIFVGTPGKFGEGQSGLTLSAMVNNNQAVGGVNAGGFYDPNGVGTGGIPDGLVICDGNIAWDGGGGSFNLVGFDGDGILHVGKMSAQDAVNANIRWAVSFGPSLIVNGQICSGLISGVNPRTAIGQRADGAVLLLVIDGRQVNSLGASFEDLAEIMLEYGAVNASNLDGGSSTLMIYRGETLNVCASVYGPRAIATSFLVR